MPKKLLKNATSLHDKGLGEHRDTRNIPKHNKGIVKARYSKPTVNIKLERNSKQSC